MLRSPRQPLMVYLYIETHPFQQHLPSPSCFFLFSCFGNTIPVSPSFLKFLSHDRYHSISWLAVRQNGAATANVSFFVYACLHCLPPSFLSIRLLPPPGALYVIPSIQFFDFHSVTTKVSTVAQNGKLLQDLFHSANERMQSCRLDPEFLQSSLIPISMYSPCQELFKLSNKLLHVTISFPRMCSLLEWLDNSC